MESTCAGASERTRGMVKRRKRREIRKGKDRTGKTRAARVLDLGDGDLGR